MAAFGKKFAEITQSVKDQTSKFNLKSKQKLTALFDAKVNKIEPTERYRENMQRYLDVKTSNNELLDQLKKYEKSAAEHLQESFQLQQVLAKFANNSCGVGREDFDAFRAISVRVIHLQKRFADSAIDPMVAGIENIASKAKPAMAGLQSRKNAAKAAMLELNRMRSKVAAINSKDQSAMNLTKLREATLECQMAAATYKQTEISMENAMDDYVSETAFQLLDSFSNYLLQLFKQYREGSSMLESMEDFITLHFAANVKREREEVEQEHRARDAEQKRIAEMVAVPAQNIMDPVNFEKQAESWSQIDDPVLLGGEELLLRTPRVVNLVDGSQQIAGCLFLTSYRVVFQPYTAQTDSQEVVAKMFDVGYLSIPHNAISRVENMGGARGLMAGWCKDNRNFVLAFRHTTTDVALVCEHVAWASDHVFALAYTPNIPASETEEERKPPQFVDRGWSTLDLQAEYGRMGIPSQYYRVSTVNSRYQLCGTYPSRLVFPATFNDGSALDAAKYRTKSRLPVLTWKNPMHPRAALFRSSQPKLGVVKARSLPDERLLRLMGVDGDPEELSEERYLAQVTQYTDSSIMTNSTKDLLIVDCRPQKNAIGNVAKGGGWEISDNYLNCNLDFVDIENIHVVRNALSVLKNSFLLPASGIFKLRPPPVPATIIGLPKPQIEKIVASTLQYLDGLESNERYTTMMQELRSADRVQWFKLVSSIMKAAVMCCEPLTKERPSSVLVHCSDGWDRTSQVVALTELMIDPYFRTMKGFGVLIEKEWVAFGHKFADRLGHCASSGEGEKHAEEMSPVFLQFLDAVYQLITQFPTEFDFNTMFLIDLVDHSYSCRFGTFLTNCHQDTAKHKLPLKTVSLWSFVFNAAVMPFYLNPNFRPTSTKLEVPLKPDYSLDKIRLFPFYFRWDVACPKIWSLLDRDFIPEASPQGSKLPSVLSFTEDINHSNSGINLTGSSPARNNNNTSSHGNSNNNPPPRPPPKGTRNNDDLFTDDFLDLKSSTRTRHGQ